MSETYRDEARVDDIANGFSGLGGDRRQVGCDDQAGHDATA